jgi:predicted phage terminase large subunit-like protein
MRKKPVLSEVGFDKFADELRGWIADSVSPFEDDTPEKKADRIERARADKLFFFQTYLPHYFSTDFGDFHREWEAVTELKDEVFLLGAPREHAKSTFFTFGVPVHNIVYQLRRFQIICSDTNDQATGFTLAIRVELEENPRLKHDFGDLRGTKWQAGDFVANDCRTLARGHGQRVRGLKHRQYRPDFAVADDFENDENVQNPRLVAARLDWLISAVIGSMGKGFLFLMVGNLFHPKSVLSQLIAAREEETGEKLYKSFVYEAWIDYGLPTQRPLWPANWPPERLEHKRKIMGSRLFNKEMMNKVAVEDAAFQESWIVGYEPEELNGKLLVNLTGADPSATSKDTSDFKALISVALDPQAMIFYVLHAYIRIASPGGFFEQAYRQHDEYGGQVVVEENMLKDFLHEAIANFAKDKKRYIPWKAVQHSTNKIARIIGTLQYLVEFGKLRFRRGHSDQERLIEQLLYLEDTNTNDDGPDALEMAVSELQKGGGSMDFMSTGKRREILSALGGEIEITDRGFGTVRSADRRYPT